MRRLLGAIDLEPRRTIYSAAILDQALRDGGCTPDKGDYPALISCSAGVALRMDAVSASVARSLVTLGSSLRANLTPATSHDKAVHDAQLRAQTVERSLATTLTTVGALLKLSTEKTDKLAMQVHQVLAGQVATFRELEQLYEAAVTGSAEEAEVLELQQKIRDQLVLLYRDDTRTVLDLARHILSLATALQGAHDAIVEARFAAYADRSARLDQAHLSVKKALDGWQATLNLIHPLAAIGGAVTKGIPAIGSAIGGAVANVSKRVFIWAALGVGLFLFATNPPAWLTSRSSSSTKKPAKRAA